VETNR